METTLGVPAEFTPAFQERWLGPAETEGIRPTLRLIVIPPLVTGLTVAFIVALAPNLERSPVEIGLIGSLYGLMWPLFLWMSAGSIQRRTREVELARKRAGEKPKKR